MEPSRVKTFLASYDSGHYSEEEHRAFVEWLKTAPAAELAAVVETVGDLTEAKTTFLPADPALAAKIAAVIETPAAKLVPLYRFPFRRIAAAAVVLVLGLSVFFIFKRRPAKELIAAGTTSAYKNDLSPGGNKATLTLANGATIVLDSASDGRLAQQGNAAIVKTGSGQLSYTALGGKPGETLYNSLSTPRGGQYRIVLPDGSKVWLNAASSLRFPTVFTGAERKVELTGEAYFEISHVSIEGSDKRMPFIVHMNTAAGHTEEIEVLGTHFNVNAYPDEEAINTTLLEGSVSLRQTGTMAPTVLKPGQQASLNTAGEIKVTDDVNTDEVVAWINNRFYFRSADIKTVMRQLARWYDVEIDYRKQVQGRFNAEIPRNTYASDVLKALELTGKVKFGIEGKKIIVMP
ncbi:MAG TPA: FecR domain-containing protein [Chitinophagaceae bacterium]|nr:FecR domain-containing protein [Chitinophagaceae bacterium]